MQDARQFEIVNNSFLLLLMSLALSGCLMDEPGLDSGDDATQTLEVSGSVGDGPVAYANLKAFKNDDSLLAEFDSTSEANYNVSIRTKGRFYPLRIEATGGTDLVTNLPPDFVLKGAVADPGKNAIANLNPFSTLAMELARDLPGGVSKENISQAQDIVVSALNYGLTTLAYYGPMGTEIDDTNIAEIVRASEALGETVRRTRDLLQTFGYQTSGDEVIAALASDLTDWIIDGRGGPRADARTAAVATIVATAVQLETMSNELRVNGEDATNAMNAAISQVMTTAPSTGIEDLTVTTDMLTSVSVGLAAASAVSDSPSIAELQQAVNRIRPGTDSAQVRNLLPAGYTATFDNVLMAVAGSDESVISTINDVSLNGGEVPLPDEPAPIEPPPSEPPPSEPPPNQPPSISGNPPTEVTANSPYDFTPNTSDPDAGDILTFTGSGIPGWASFDPDTGRLSGTPGDADVRTYDNITITVSDGTASDTLGPFSITVAANEPAPNEPPPDEPPPDEPPPNQPPSISGNPPTEVTANSPYEFRPEASDPDAGDTLTFTGSGIPRWANLNRDTGRLSGTPGDGDVGTYDVSITVSDGSASDTLSFSITVQAISLGSATLNWNPPTQNADGSPLTDLAGFKFYWGTTSGNYPNSVTLNNPGLTTYVIENLAPGTYEFVATSFNTSGVESAYSNPATKTVP